MRFWSISFPRLISSQLGKLYLRYVDGKPLSSLPESTLFNEGWIFHAAASVHEFAGHREFGLNDIDAYCKYLEPKCEEVGIDPSVITEPLRKAKSALAVRTFCHGDFSTMNLLALEEGRLAAIDAHHEKYVRSYLTDAAKFVASLRGLQDALTEDGSGDRKDAAERFLSMFTDAERAAIEAMRRSMILRVAPYAKKAGKEAVLCQLLRLIK
jgi:hypothetical protein